MEGQGKGIDELDKLELLNKATAYNKSVAKGAEILYKHDVSGDVFLTMTNEDFKELGIESFGVRKSLMMFREKVLKLEATPKGQLEKGKMNHSLEPIPDNEMYTEDQEIKKDFDADIPEINYQPGETPLGELSVDSESTSEDIFQKPKPNATLKKQGENDVVDDCKSCLTEVPNVKEKKMPRVKYPPKNKIEHLSPKKSKSNNDDEASSGTLFLDLHASDYKSNSNMSMVSSGFKRQHKDWVISEKVTWDEDGKRRSANTFMELQSENEILLQGYVQKLTGVNSKWNINHWTSRYGVLLKSRVLLIFQYDSKTLVQRGAADLRLVATVGVPQTDIAAGTLKFDICMTTNKRIVLGFKSEAQLLMWRNDIISLVNGYDNLQILVEKETM